MDTQALERAKQRIAEAAAGRPEPAAIEAALERSRAQIEELAVTAAELEVSIPEHVSAAVRDGVRAEVLPVARHIAEIRGLLNQAIRRLERLEGDLLAERHARVDDLALLVDLVSSGWRGVDVRLERLESMQPRDGSRAGGRAARTCRRRARARARRRSLTAEARYERAGDTGSTSLKRLPAPDVRAELDPAAERDRELASDRKPEASAVRVLRDERLEDLRALRRRHARPGVDDVDRDDAVRRTEPQLDAAAVRRPAERVREEVRDHLQHAISVGHDDGRGLRPRERVVDLAATRLLGERSVGLVEHALEVDLLVPHREAVSLELREVEHVSDESLEPVGLRRDDLERRREPAPAR